MRNLNILKKASEEQNMSFSFQCGILETTFNIHTFGEKTKMNFFKYLSASYLIEMTTVKIIKDHVRVDVYSLTLDPMTFFLTLSHSLYLTFKGLILY